MILNIQELSAVQTIAAAISFLYVAMGVFAPHAVFYGDALTMARRDGESLHHFSKRFKRRQYLMTGFLIASLAITYSLIADFGSWYSYLTISCTLAAMYPAIAKGPGNCLLMLREDYAKLAALANSVG
jgi:hypothetical protein